MDKRLEAVVVPANKLVRLRFEFVTHLNRYAILNQFENFNRLLLSKHSNCFSLPSISCGNITGFERNYSFLYNLENHFQFEQFDLLLHLTCHDICKTTFETKFKALEEKKIKQLLVVTGDDYQYDKTANKFENSLELVKFVRSNSDFIEKIAIAGYPTVGKQTAECSRLARKIAKTKADVIYTQCVMEAKEFESFRDELRRHHSGEIKIFPSIMLFKSLKNLEKSIRIVYQENFSAKVEAIIDELALKSSLEEQKTFCKHYLINLLKDLIQLEPEEINICTMDLFEFANEIITELKEDPAINLIRLPENTTKNL